MNFTSSPFERMMKEVPHPGWDNDDPCKGCRQGVPVPEEADRARPSGHRSQGAVKGKKNLCLDCACYMLHKCWTGLPLFP